MLSKFLDKFWLHILIIISVLTFGFFTVNSIVIHNNEGLIQEWEYPNFSWSYDDDNDEYDCFIQKEKRHVYVQPENVVIRYLDNSYHFREYILQKWVVVEGIANVEEYRLIMYLI